MKAPSGKVIWAFGRMLPLLYRVIVQSRFIATDEKEGLYRGIEKAYHQLEDAYKREVGQVPPTPEAEKKRKGEVNSRRSSVGLPPLV